MRGRVSVLPQANSGCKIITRQGGSGIKMKIKRLIKITDLTGDFVFEIDFQETPNDYRIKRVDNLMKKYPKGEYVWDVVFEGV